MKWTAAAVAAATTVLLSSTANTAQAFTPATAAQLRRRPQRSHFLRVGTPAPSFSDFLALKMSSSDNSEQSPTFTVGIVGATGAVGEEIRKCLEARNFPLEQLRVFGSSRSAGKVLDDGNDKITVELFDVNAARECDVVFLAVSGDFALEHAKALTEGNDGCVCIDNSSAFRYEKDIPLVVPEINGQETCKSKLVANPNCTTAIGLMALWPLHQAFGLKKIIMSTYQAASGAGQPGMDELREGTKELLATGKHMENKVFAHPLPFNVIPQIDKFMDNGYTKEEMKVAWECRKICDLGDGFPVSCTAVRIPTFRAHAESIVVETERPVDLDLAHQVLSDAPGVVVVDDPAKMEYPMPAVATGKDDVQVGRLRKSIVFENGMEFFVCGDQLLRGAALNAVLVAEAMIGNGSLKPKVMA